MTSAWRGGEGFKNCPILRTDKTDRIIAMHLLVPELIFVTGLVKFVTAVARLVCPDLLG